MHNEVSKDFQEAKTVTCAIKYVVTSSGSYFLTAVSEVGEKGKQFYN